MKKLSLGLTAIIAIASCTACFGRSLLESLFGPPAVAMEEYYADDKGESQVDHSSLNRVLKSCVVADGYVDYAKLATEKDSLAEYIEVLEQADFAGLSRDGKLATLINAYNAFTLQLILDHLPLESIRDIPSGERWAAQRWNLGGTVLSLEELENKYLRSRFVDPRIHFAINCASISCPPLRGEAYRTETIDAQLSDQARVVHSSPRWFLFDAAADTVTLTALYRWYSTDFLQVKDSQIDFAASFSSALAKRLEQGGKPDLLWLDYDWQLNSPK